MKDESINVGFFSSILWYLPICLLIVQKLLENDGIGSKLSSKHFLLRIGCFLSVDDMEGFEAEKKFYGKAF